MINAYSELISYEGEFWEDYLKKTCLYEVFGELAEEYCNEKEILTGLIRYISFVYSLESNKIISKMEWVANKKKVFKLVNLPEIMEQSVVFLKDKTILYAIKKWLNLQDGEHFSTWAMLNDLIMEMRIAANSPIKKSVTKDNPDGEIDYEAKRKCAESVIDLLVKKAEVEQKFIQNNEKLKEAYKEVSHLNNKQNGTTMGLETMLKERQS